MLLNESKNIAVRASGYFRRALLAIVFGLTLFLSSAPAFAFCIPGCCFTVVVPFHEETREIIRNEHDHLREEVFGFTFGIGSVLPVWEVPEPPPGVNRLQHHERWLLLTFFKNFVLRDLMSMTEQLTSVMMNQMFIVGTFFDAKMQLDTQLLFQQLTARAHKDYHPSFNMCEVGGNTRSLAAADFNGDFTKMVLNKHFLDRQLGTGASVGAGGPTVDRMSDAGPSPTTYNRLGYFLHNTCDDNDLNKIPGRADTGLFLCADGAPSVFGWVNRDIDWNNTVMGPRTINVDYKPQAWASTSDNHRLFEMSNYLYGHDVFVRPDGSLLHYEQNHDNFLDSRAVTAKRSVAQTSFNSIAGLKSRGTRMVDPGNPREFSSEQTSQFMRFYMVELGFPLDDPLPYHQYLFQKNPAVEPIGADDPIRDEISYYAQMEVLAKKLYQRPEFYTDLYEKPANIKRKSAAMQAIKLMLDRDIFDSQLRGEAMMSMILELKVLRQQQNVENMLGLVKEKTK